jgi:hypothetical protein
MKMDPQWIIAICAGVTLLILWSTTIIGGAIWLMRQLKELKTEILADFDNKHQENSRKVDALETLVIRHETILEPEFNGGAGNPYVPNRRHR